MSNNKFHSAIKAYLLSLSETYSTGSATEHTYRPSFQKFLETVLPSDAQIINEPRQIDCGAPDFVLTLQNIPKGYIETKDLGRNLDDDRYREQISRYSASLDNLIVTNYLEFRLIRDGNPGSTVKIGTLNSNGKLIPERENYDDLIDILKIFWDYDGQPVTSVIDLTRHMAAKTRLLERAISRTLNEDQQDGDNLYGVFQHPVFQKTLQRQFEAFQKGLMRNLDFGTFADIYAQTVAYGMFSARLHDTSPDTFARHNANRLIPKTNPLLRKFFDEVAGNDLDSSIRWIVDDLACLFSRANLDELMDDHGATTQRNDPYLHFYETFLGEYDPDLRDVRGVYYTPEPVVRFMVRAVDQILCDSFHLTKGLATKTREIKVKGMPVTNGVQILDPATGTGTFLAAIIKEVHDRYFSSTQSGIWPEYARHHLVPRLHGFEILMAPYAMAHTKLEMVLRETGCEPDNRLGIFLTNALEDTTETKETLYPMLSEEAESAKTVKGEMPVMVVIGNPPYKGESTNKGVWIEELLETYKQEPGGGKLQERNPKWLNDDYVKFIRYGQHHIDNTGVGILAYINNHGFLDNPTFRGMRWSLLESFDEIYIIDLHGNAKKNELAPDGTIDQNVFDIQQGVSINLFVKTGKEDGKPARLLHYDLYGTREEKYRFLENSSLNGMDFKAIEPRAPQFFFVPRDYSFQNEYDRGISLTELFQEKSVGIVTARDSFTLYHTERELKSAIEKFLGIDDETARRNFSLREDVRDWKVAWARKDLTDHFNRGEAAPVKINYRPFDTRYTYYTGKSRGFHCMPRHQVMQHFINRQNVGKNTGLVLCRQNKSSEYYQHVFITDSIFESTLVSNKTSEICTGFPLYLNPNPKQKDLNQNRPSNLNQEIAKSMAKSIGLQYSPEKGEDDDSLAPMDILDYVYAVLHSRTYREKYREFLKTGFPKIPRPTDQSQFWKLVELGSRLRSLHLMESPDLDSFITGYATAGNNKVESLEYVRDELDNQSGSVFINEQQSFDNVPRTVWDYCIGGYQPAQKWLKDRKSRILTYDDIETYQKMIVALDRTAEIMLEIDDLDVVR